MSKKLIAVAAAAALALTGLVVMPTVATAVGPFSVDTSVSDTLSRAASSADGSTADKELTILVPSQDAVRLDTRDVPSTSITGTLLRFNVTTPAGGAAVTATAAGGGAKLVTQAQVTAGDLTTASGTASISVTSDTDGEVTFYAYTTSTSDSTVTVASGSNSKVLYMKGVTDDANAYKLNFTASPSATAASGKVKFTGTVADMFGNLLTIEEADLDVDGLGGDLGADEPFVDWAQNSTTKVVTFEVVNRSTTGVAAMNLHAASTLGASGVFTKVTAFGDPVANQFFTVTAVDLSAQVTALTAQVAALQAIVDRKVSKKRYNTLARKWNAANPSARVALKK